jgi:hypothetical protein
MWRCGIGFPYLTPDIIMEIKDNNLDKMEEINNRNLGAVVSEPGGTLPGFAVLVRESIDVYTKFWRPLVALQLLSVGGALILTVLLFSTLSASGIAGTALAGRGNYFTPLMLGGAAIFFAGFFLFFTWTDAAMVVAIRDRRANLGWQNYLFNARAYVLRCAIASLLSFLIVFFGLALFVVPGILFWFWLMFAKYAIIVENENWLSALEKSYDNVRGNFWRVALLAVLGVLVMCFVNAVLEVLKALPAGGFLSMAVSVFISPIFAIYYFLIFSYSRTARGFNPATPIKTSTGKNFILGFGLAGLLLAFAAVGLAVYYAPRINDYLNEEIQEFKLQNPSLNPAVPVDVKLQ